MTAIIPTQPDAREVLDHLGRRVEVTTTGETRYGTLVAVTRNGEHRRGQMVVLRQNGEPFDEVVPLTQVTGIRRTAGRPATARVKAPRHLRGSNRRTGH